MRKTASHPLRVSEAAIGMIEDDEKQEMRRRLFERFMASCGPGSPYLFEGPKVYSSPCVLYTIRVSIKKVQAFWSHQSSRRFFPERQGCFPIPLCRAAGPDYGLVEPVVDRPGAPGEPSRLGIVSVNYQEERYRLLEESREKGVIHKDGSPAAWREVAVIRGMAEGRGITVTSHVKHLVVRLHDFLFILSGSSATVDLRFSEKWFRIPAGWTEERLFAEDGFLIVDLGSSVEDLVKKLCDLREQEEREMERRSSETEEERDMRLREAAARRLQEEEERREIRERNLEKERRRREEDAAIRSSRAPHVWDAAFWLINEAQPAAVHGYSKFRLSMNSNKKVSCDCVGKGGRQRVDHNFLLISKAAASSSALETLGFVEGDSFIETVGYEPQRICYFDRSGRTVSPVLMVSRSMAKELTVRVLADKLNVVMDDGMIMSCRSGVSVNIHCDDVSSSELLKTDWAYQILCKNIDGEGRTSFSTLLAHLKKKLQLQLTKEELELYNMSAIDGEEESEDLAEPLRKLKEWIPPKPKPELAEVELHDCSLFSIPWESEI